jgi:hypothetical protein
MSKQTLDEQISAIVDRKLKVLEAALNKRIDDKIAEALGTVKQTIDTHVDKKVNDSFASEKMQLTKTTSTQLATVKRELRDEIMQAAQKVNQTMRFMSTRLVDDQEVISEYRMGVMGVQRDHPPRATKGGKRLTAPHTQQPPDPKQWKPVFAFDDSDEPPKK